MGAKVRSRMYRLLIVDDEEDIRRGLADFFPWEEIGFLVVGTAENGKQALDIVSSGGVDAVFCDIRMPILSGIDLARTLFEAHSKIPVVFLSAYKDFSYAQQALQYGVRNYVLKPTNYMDIRSVFQKLKLEMDAQMLAMPEPAGGAGGTESQAETAVAVIKGYVEREYAQATLKGAAGIAHMNPQYVSRLFKEKTGENFHTFLTRVKMRKAAQLLRDFSYRTYEVSSMVGYSNQKNFTRSFKQFYGVSPRDYRHSM